MFCSLQMYMWQVYFILSLNVDNSVYRWRSHISNPRSAKLIREIRHQHRRLNENWKVNINTEKNAVTFTGRKFGLLERSNLEEHKHKPDRLPNVFNEKSGPTSLYKWLCNHENHTIRISRRITWNILCFLSESNLERVRDDHTDDIESTTRTQLDHEVARDVFNWICKVPYLWLSQEKSWVIMKLILWSRISWDNQKAL